MRIVITECDHDAFNEEFEAAEAAGVELVVAQSSSQDELVENCAGADGIVVQYASITAEIMDALPSVRVIGRYGVGFDTIDVEAATQRGIAVCNVPDYGTEAVSDHAIALALSAAREIPRLDRGVREGRVEFPAIRPLNLVGRRIFGIIGLGRIGSSTARKAAALGYEVLCHDILAGGASAFRGYAHVGLDDLLERSQVVSLHTPLDTTTRHLIGARELGLMRSDATLVNTARGAIVDTLALAEAVRNGGIRSAALDVTEIEPIPLDHPLLEVPQVILTPHTAWYSEESYGELKRRAVENVANVLAGGTSRDIVNPKALSRGRCVT